MVWCGLGSFICLRSFGRLLATLAGKPATAESAIDRINKVFGKHAGYRALHAKGTLCKGTFTATSSQAIIAPATTIPIPTSHQIARW